MINKITKTLILGIQAEFSFHIVTFNLEHITV
jgi:hypothetical protein